MRIEPLLAVTPPAFRLRLTFGGIGTTAKTPVVVALPWQYKSQSAGRQVVQLDPNERLDGPAIEAVENAVAAGCSAVVACASLADAVIAFGDLAEAAGYSLDGAA